MKIRCKNCYRVLNPNEEYCTNCGEHSARMQQAMLTGNYGPDATGKLKIALTIFGIAGFIICGLLQVVFALIENKINDGNGYTNLFCESNSLFYSSILTIIITLVVFRKDLKDYFPTINKKQLLGSILIAILVSAIVIILTNLSNFTLLFPKYIVNYLKTDDKVFFDIVGSCIFKIVIGAILVGISVEILGHKYLVDALDETLLGDKAIYFITVIASTFMEVIWIMSIDVLVVSLIINLATTGIYMYTNRNLLINIIMRVLITIIAVVIFII